MSGINIKEQFLLIFILFSLKGKEGGGLNFNASSKSHDG
jgi:hypothetical protein